MITDEPIRAISASGGYQRSTRHVLVTCPAGAANDELAETAGYGSQHFGFSVTRHKDATATVHLFND